MRVNREELLRNLDLVSAGLSTTRETVEQGRCFVFSNGHVYTFNDEIFCSIDSLLEFDGAVDARTLIGVLQKSTDDVVDIETKKEKLVIKTKSARSIIAFEKDILLPIDSVEEPEEWYDLEEDFCEAVGLVQKCASKDDNFFSLTCVHISNDFLEACDNLQYLKYPINTDVKQASLVRRDNIKHIVHLGMTEISETQSWLHFRNKNGLVLCCRRYLEDYPDFEGLDKVEGSPTVLPGSLPEVVDRALVFSSNSAESDNITVELKEGKMKISGYGPHGKHEEMKKIKYSGDSIEFVISPKLLIEIMARTKECLISSKKLVFDGGKFVYTASLGVSSKDVIESE